VTYRQGQDNDDLNSRVLSTFLNELDGITGQKDSGGSTNDNNEGGVLVVVTCSSLSILDEALIRPGRLHVHIHLDFPTAAEVKQIMEVKLSNLPVADDVTVDSVLQRLNLFQPTASDLNGICRRAVEAALREAITDDKHHDTSTMNVHLRHFSAAT
jgi:transitional endoplasmic reticulum ATPase